MLNFFQKVNKIFLQERKGGKKEKERERGLDGGKEEREEERK